VEEEEDDEHASMTVMSLAAAYVVNRPWGICASLVILALTVRCVNWKTWLEDNILLTFAGEVD
jgi:hypothetical protein